MGTLKEDIKKQSDWIVQAFAADKLDLNYTIESFILLDLFMNKHTINGKAKRGGRLDGRLGPILFSIGSYIGETLLKVVPGSKWITDDTDAEGELNITVKFPDNGLVFPVQRMMKRFKNGVEESLYVYGHKLTEKFTQDPFNDAYWDLIREKKPWWKLGFL